MKTTTKTGGSTPMTRLRVRHTLNNVADYSTGSSSGSTSTNTSSRKTDEEVIPTKDDKDVNGSHSHCCWVCHVPLLPSYAAIYKSLQSSACFYKCQKHPFLALSSSSSFSTSCCSDTSCCVCAVCADHILSLEQDVSTEEMDGCSLCGKRNHPDDEEIPDADALNNDNLFTRQLTQDELGAYFDEETLLLLCDTCPRAVCEPCWKRYKPSFQSTADPLQCPLCSNPPQDTFSESSQEEENLDVHVLSCLLAQYEAELMEAELHRTEVHLDVTKESIRNELRMESSDEPTQIKEEELEFEARQEILLYRKFWEHHMTRLQVEIPILQELLELAGRSLQEFYREIQTTSDASLLQLDEHAIREADLVLQERDKTELHTTIGASGYKARNEKIYELDPYPSSDEDEEDEDYEDGRYIVEDLQSLSDALHATTSDNTRIHPCWRAPCLPEEKMFRKALQEEDRQRQQFYLEDNDTTNDWVQSRRAEKDELQEKDGVSALLLQVRRVQQRKQTKTWNAVSKPRRPNKRKTETNEPKDTSSSTSGQPRTTNIHKRRIPLMTTTTSGGQSEKEKEADEFQVDRNIIHNNHVSDVLFMDSDFCLYDPENDAVDITPSSSNGAPLPLQSLLKQKVTVAYPIANELKEHQREGIQFMWNNVCGSTQPVQGCILAHNMGLGKSLQTIALIHSLLTHPAFVRTDSKCPSLSKMESFISKDRLIRKVLLLAPVNTLANWECEFIKWIQSSELDSDLVPIKGVPQIPIYPLYTQTRDQRITMVKKWHKFGGVLLTSPQKFATLAAVLPESLLKEAILSPGPDVMIVDEAHGVFNKEGKKISPILADMTVTRRIALTGTPFQNNLFEYFVMANWVRPGCLGSVTDFKRDYVKPIMDGLKADSSQDQKIRQEELIYELYKILGPFVHRKDSTILQQDLPFLQQTVIVVRQSRAQQRILQLHKRYQAVTTKNFFDAYTKLKPIFNHPGTLLLRRPATPSLRSHDADKPKLLSSDFAPPARTIAVNSQQQRVDQKSIPKKEEITSVTLHLNSTQNGVGLHDNVAQTSIGKLECRKEEVTSTSVKIKGEIVAATSSISQDVPKNKDANKTTLSNGLKVDEIIDLVDTEDEDPEVAEVNGRSSPLLMENDWWEDILETVIDLSDIEHGRKMILLLQILAYADHIGEKAVIFCHSLRTLDFIEKLLNQPQWESKISAIKQISPGKTWGGWKKNIDYVRIDGGTEATIRGELITQFNEKNSASMSQLKLFLLSSKAGGVGINLVAATRVIIIDPHFNPAVDLQALYRCYRYGQTKPVFVYRLICEGTMEEKVYRRQINKTSLSKRLIDQNNPARHFTARELEDIAEMDLWVQCDKCDKWRLLPPGMQNEMIPDEWYCSMNVLDPERSTCDAKERDIRWYHNHFHSAEAVVEESETEMQSEEKEAYTKRDKILSGIISSQRGELMRQRGPGQVVENWLSKYHFHDALLKDDPALSRTWVPNSRQNTPARPENSAPQCTKTSLTVSTSSISNTSAVSPAPQSTIFPGTGSDKKMPAAPTSSTSPHLPVTQCSGGRRKSGERKPILATDIVIEILTSDDERNDSDFEILD